MKIWIYWILLEDQTIYIGITTNINRRWNDHEKGKGSIHTQGKKIVDKKILLSCEVKNKWHGLLVENTIADRWRNDNPGKVIRGGELSTRYKKIVKKRVFADR